MYSILRVLLGKDVLDLVGVVLNETDLATVFHWSGTRSFASDASCFQPVVLMYLGFMTVMGDKGLYDPAMNHWISLKLRRNNGMDAMTLVGRASWICLQTCLPGLSFCVCIEVILSLCGCVRLCPFCVVGLEGHGMAGTGIVVSGHRYRMFRSSG